MSSASPKFHPSSHMETMKIKHSTGYGMLLLVCGILLMVEPMLTHLQGHSLIRHAIIAFGAACVLLSYPLLGNRPEK